MASRNLKRDWQPTQADDLKEPKRQARKTSPLQESAYDPTRVVLIETNELILVFLSYLDALDLRRAICTCRNWHALIQKHRNALALPLCLVTVSGENEVCLVSAGNNNGSILQRIKASPLRTVRKRPWMRRNSQQAWCWPTCLVTGPQKQLYLSQYKVRGVLEFERCVHGYQYRRTLFSGPSLTSPEGLVCAHNSLYIVSVEHATVSRISVDGRVLQRAYCSSSAMRSDGSYWILWGMCSSPDKSTLFIAAHTNNPDDENETEDYHVPTQACTGTILQLDLEPDGSFRKSPSSDNPVGYYIANLPSGLQLNRPSNPVFCPHGILHVSSFISTACGNARRIHKFIFPYGGDIKDNASSPTTTITANQFQQPTYFGWLASEEDSRLAELNEPWGVGFPEVGTLVTCSTTRCPSVLKLETCGCNAIPSPKTSSGANPNAGPIFCGEATVILQPGSLNQSNFILPLM